MFGQHVWTAQHMHVVACTSHAWEVRLLAILLVCMSSNHSTADQCVGCKSIQELLEVTQEIYKRNAAVDYVLDNVPFNLDRYAVNMLLRPDSRVLNCRCQGS